MSHTPSVSNRDSSGKSGHYRVPHSYRPGHQQAEKCNDRYDDQSPRPHSYRESTKDHYDLVLRLYDKRDVKLSQVDDDPQLSSDYDYFRYIVNYYRENNQKLAYQELAQILSSFPPPTQIEKDTIGSYLYGCSQSNFGDVDRSCALSCVEGFDPNFNTKPCQQQIWQYAQGKLVSLYTSADSTEALIYVDNDFTGLSEAQLEQLRVENVMRISVLVEQNGRYVRLLPLTDISQLPHTIRPASRADDTKRSAGRRREKGKNSSSSGCSGNSCSTSRSSNSSGSNTFWIIVIVIIIAIIILGALYYGLGHKYQQPDQICTLNT